MINQGAEPIQTIYNGEMGIKYVFVGEENIYTRKGGYLFIELKTEGESE